MMLSHFIASLQYRICIPRCGVVICDSFLVLLMVILDECSQFVTISILTSSLWLVAGNLKTFIAHFAHCPVGIMVIP